MPYLFLKRCGLLVLFTTTFFRCQQAVDIENFDEAAFMKDAEGCLGQRIQMKEQILKLPQHLSGLSQQEIQKTLGKADRQELSNRSQKYLIYFIEPAPSCEGNTTDEEPLTMYVRFNSVGLANEISFKNY
ncbi:hypothetical protein OKW21_001396 [Catalinimonas alkaloidigena]|uniref:hypothetical protein n=1 Tax=Catalinimonas alkaloidigena TaxID=1075417 RepID=UPI002405D9C5|nr:hypothetical protein [Catalinimonas alkaloidigena]MDF9796133.1 hypothetical protein [Catalinimonas alkaloidigena]